MYRYAVIDIETTGLDRYKESITYVGIGLAEDVGSPLSKKLMFNLFELKEQARLLNTVEKLKAKKIKLIFQNGKFDTLFLERHGYGRLPIHHDVMLMGTAFDLSAEHGLKSMAKRYLGVADWDVNKKTKTSSNNLETEKYLMEGDVPYTWELFCFFHERLDEKQWFVYENLLRPAYLMYRKVERIGVYIDLKNLEKVKKEYKLKQDEKLKALNNRYDINWNSPKQVSDALFVKEGLPQQKISEKTGIPSADAKSMKRLAAKGFDLPTMLLEYKFYYGANTKFLNKWGLYAAHDGRIHPNFGLTNVVTGRTSCSDPNLQQVPRNVELRSLFTAPKGRAFIEADYSQIELRVAADYANDPTMIKIYNTGGDIHTETGCSLAGCSPKDLAKELRSKAKAVNFGFLYGMSSRGFIDYAFDSYGVVFNSQEAERYRQLFFTKYSRLLAWHKEMEVICDLQGGVENRWGQFRSLPDIYSDNRFERSKAIRRAINTPVQGTASGLLLLAAVEIDRKLSKDMDLKIVGTVHDSILIDVPEIYVQSAEVEIKRIMAHPEAMDLFGVSFRVPIEADVGIGAWGSK